MAPSNNSPLVAQIDDEQGRAEECRDFEASDGVVITAPARGRMQRMMHYGCITEVAMRITINLDEQLIKEAQRLTGTQERTALIHDGLRALIARESAKRLACLGGSAPKASASRRRP